MATERRRGSELEVEEIREVVHELNNALMLIVGNAELLAVSPELPPSLRPVVQQIMESAERVSQMAAGIATERGAA